VTLRVTDRAIPTAETATEQVQFVTSPRKLTITTASLAEARVGRSYSGALQVIMGTAPLRWSSRTNRE
jgi:hypothetical protein